MTNRVGFITPTAKQPIMMEYKEVLDFCRSICMLEENKESFDEFQKDYTYFDPSFDFVMMKLDYAFLFPMYKENSVLMRRDKAIFEIPIYDFEDGSPSYRAIASCELRPQMAALVPVSDQELRIESLAGESQKYRELKTCMVDPNLYMMMSQNEGEIVEGSHEVTSASILNQLLITSEEICENYQSHKLLAKRTGQRLSPLDYLVGYLGFARCAVYADGETIFIQNENCSSIEMEGFVEKQKDNSNFTATGYNPEEHYEKEQQLIERYQIQHIEKSQGVKK